MNNVIWIISTLLIFCFSGITFKELFKNQKKYNSNIIKPNKLFLIIGSVCSIILLILVLIAWFLETTSSLTEKYVYSSLIILFTILVGGYLILFYMNFRIIVYEDRFLYQNFWRVKKIIYYKDLIIDKSKLYPQVKIKKENNKTKLIFKLSGILENEEIFTNTYKNWKNKNK